MPKEEVGLEAQELAGELALAPDDARHGDLGVVVVGLSGHAAEEGEGGHVGVLEGLGALARVGAHEEGVRVGQAHDREVGLALLAGDLHGGLAEVELGAAGQMGEGHVDLGGVAAQAGHRDPHLGDAAAVAVLVAQTLEDALGGVALLGRRLAIGGEDLLDDGQVGPQLGLGAGRLLAVAGRLAVGEDLLQGLVGDAVLPADRALRGALHEHRPPDVGPVLHVGEHSFLLSRRKRLRKRLPAITGNRGVLTFSTGVSFQARSVRLFNRRLHSQGSPGAGPHLPRKEIRGVRVRRYWRAHDPTIGTEVAGAGACPDTTAALA